MLLLTIRTDKPEAEIGLYDDEAQIAYEVWHAHRALAETLLAKLASLLEARGRQFTDLGGIVVYKGPGSFTGLRIGLSVANALAYSYDLLIVGQAGETWQAEGARRLLRGENEQTALPEYGVPVFVTTPRK